MATAPKVLRMRRKTKHAKKVKKSRRAGTYGTYLTIFEQNEILEYYQSCTPKPTLAMLAAHFGRDVKTVTNFMRQPSMVERAEELKRSILSNTSEAALRRIDAAVRDKKCKEGVRIAWDIVERFGGIPDKVHRIAAKVGLGDEQQGEYAKMPREERLSYWAKQLAEVTLERQEMFDMPMEHIEDLKEEMKRSSILLPLKAKSKEKERV
jgi:hypothetical protein